jgi:transposase
MPHIQGASRDIVLLFPPSLDEYITDENPVRFVDAFVDQLDLQALGFTRAIASPLGRPAYHPADLLKLYLYGYLNHVRSSRLLERETHRNVEVMWLLKKLTPDFKTIADFRKDNLQPLRNVCRAFTLLCKELDLFGGDLVAIDGSKFAAVNNRSRNFTSKKLERTLLEIDAKIAAYLSELDSQDAERLARGEQRGNLQEKLAALQGRRAQYLLYQQALAESGATQLSLTDPDCRSMPVAQGTVVGYNAQVAVDAKHKLIVEHELTTAVTDQHQLSAVALRAKETLGVETLEVVADTGYYDGEEVKACLEAEITPYVAKPHTSRNQKQGLFTKADFLYDAQQDSYRCPAGAVLTYRFSTVEDGRPQRYYATSACGSCTLRAQCTRNKKGRRITRWEDEGLLDAMAERVRARPDIMKQRKQIVEHPFGTMKRTMNQGYFLLRGLDKVRVEMSLTVLAYNLKRVVTILGVRRLLEVVVSRVSNCVRLFMQLQIEVLIAGRRCAIRNVWRIFTQSGAVLGGSLMSCVSLRSFFCLSQFDLVVRPLMD